MLRKTDAPCQDPPPRVHDEACGIFFHTDCHDCQRASIAAERAASRRGQRLAELRDTQAAAIELIRIIGLHPKRLRRALLKLLTPAITQIALAVVEEARR